MTWPRAALSLMAVVVAMVAAPVTAQRKPAGSGFDVSSFDRSVRPQDNLFQYVNGQWLETTMIPEDRVSYTASAELIEKVNADVRALVEGLASAPGRRPGSPAQQVVDLYASILDEAAIEARGVAPLEPELRAIEDIDSIRALAGRTGQLSATTTAGPFFSSVGVHPVSPAERVVQLSQGGLLLERLTYLNDDEASRNIRSEYRKYLSRIFSIVGRPTPEADAEAVLALEIDLARAQAPDNRDPAGPSRPMSLSQMNAAMPGFDWAAWARPQRIDWVSAVVVMQPSFFRAFAAMVPARPLSTWRAWLVGRYVTAMSPYVTQALGDARFDFFGRTLTGQQKPIPRWKRGVSLVNAFLGDAVGRLYVEKHFSRESRARVEGIVAEIVRAYRQVVGELDWMAPSTRAAAIDKLGKLSAKIGYPDDWRDYRGFEIRPDDLFGNVVRGYRFDNERRMQRMARPDDRSQWLMTPQTVNAYYVPAQNEIVFPAAILQPPYFDATADDAVNYGAIGAVIGHEIGHALDDTGRWYDGTGAARAWWKVEDERAYQAHARLLIEQLDRYPPVEGVRLNGALVINESLGDLAGLSVAFRAYRNALGRRPGPVIDGLTGDQRFFLGWARIWRAKDRPEYRRQLFLSSRYAPADYRANGTLGNVDGFYEAFDVKAGDGLFVPPVGRVRWY